MSSVRQRQVFDAAAQRPLALRRRCDLTVRSRPSSQGRQWILKDSLALRYYHLSEPEHRLWQSLDGQVSLADLQQQFAKEFAPRRLSTAEIQEFLIRLYRQGLIVSLRPGQGRSLEQRARQKRWQDAANLVPRLLAWRFRGIDPTALLDRLQPLSRVLFHPLTVLCTLVAALVSVGVVALSWTEIQRQLPQLQDILHAQNLVLMAAALAIVKILHELGHALACRRWGGEVRELGVMFLFFTPCLYCDVSDAWLFPQRWRRMAVSAAGIYVEAIVASLATWIWCTSQPGMLHTLALNIMLVCGVGTLLLNGNPLMRYDGYYLLADFCEIPNLDERAQARLRRFLARWLLGIELPSASVTSRSHASLLLLYGLTSTAYRLVMLVGALWMLHRLLVPWGLEVFAILAAALSIIGTFIMPLVRTIWQWRDPALQRRLQPLEMARRLGIVAAIAAAILLIPWPARVRAPALVESQATQYAYATSAGRLVEAATPGERVTTGHTIARLEDNEIERDLAQLATEAERLQVRLNNLEAIRGVESAADSELPTTKELLADVRQRHAQRMADRARLTLTATMSGVVVEPPRRAAPPAHDEALYPWQGSLLDPSNRLARVEPGTLVALVVDPKQLEAQVFVSQADIGLVHVGQSAYVKLRQQPNRWQRATVREVSQMPIEHPPEALVATKDLVTTPSVAGQRELLNPVYQIRLELDEQPESVVIGGTAEATIVVAPQSFASRLYRLLRQTFSRS